MEAVLREFCQDEHIGARKLVRLTIATYLLGQMMASSTEKINGDAKELKVQAAFRYADLLLKG